MPCCNTSGHQFRVWSTNRFTALRRAATPARLLHETACGPPRSGNIISIQIAIKDYAFIPLHQQSLAWGVSKKLKVVQRADNQVLPYWMVKQEE